MEREKLFVKQAIVVEGKYDKIHLSQFVDAVIIVTNGFQIYKNPDTAELIRHYAKKDGIIILTDSDSAGNQIRGRIRSIVPDGKIYNAYAPEIFGKEKRKAQFSSEGKLGVEGTDPTLIIEAIKRSGAVSELDTRPQGERITMQDLINDGISGGSQSREKRKKILSEISLPTNVSTKAALELLNSVLTRDGYRKLVERLF